MRTIGIEDNKIAIRFDYTPGMVKKVKELPFRRWDPLDKAWTLPANRVLANKAVEFGDALDFIIAPEVYDLASYRERIKKSDRSKLYDFQKEAVDFIHKNGGTCLVADDMGLGKTIEALVYLREKDFKRVLIVCPASVTYKWLAEVEKWTDIPAQLVRKTADKLDKDCPIWIMSYAIMTNKKKQLLPFKFDLIVADECHYLKWGGNKKTKRVKAFFDLFAKRSLFLSGTPFLNRPVELWNLLQVIFPGEFYKWYEFVTRYCGAYQYNIGSQKIWNYDGATNLEELREKLKPVMIRRTKQDVSMFLPELTRSFMEVKGSGLQDYKKALKDLQEIIRIEGNLKSPDALVRLSALRQAIGLLKVPHAVSLAEDILVNQEKKVVIYAHHKNTVNALVSQLEKYGVLTIVGDDSQKKRAETINKFQNREIPRVLVISSAGGEGIDLFRASEIIFCEREWNAAKEEQAEARLHRNGQKNPVTAYYLVVNNTVDRKISLLIEKKRGIFDSIIGNADIKTEFMEEVLNK